MNTNKLKDDTPIVGHGEWHEELYDKEVEKDKLFYGLNRLIKKIYSK